MHIISSENDAVGGVSSVSVVKRTGLERTMESVDAKDRVVSSSNVDVDANVRENKLDKSVLTTQCIEFNKRFGFYTRYPLSLINFIIFDAVVVVYFGLHKDAGMGSWLSVYGLGVLYIGLLMSVCLHRFFAHQAFSASRLVTFALAFAGCCTLQRGPIWWAAIHLKHHANCDTDDDPHSPVKSGWWGCIFFSSFDSDIDWKYVPKRLLLPELLILDVFHFVPPTIACAVLYKAFGNSLFHVMFLGLLPMTLSVLMSNIFNWRFHDDHDSVREVECRAVDRETELMANVVGENLHEEHHIHPRLAQRHAFDIPYWIGIYPLLKLGLIWDAQYKEDEKEKVSKDGKQVAFSVKDLHFLKGLKNSLIECVVIGSTCFLIARTVYQSVFASSAI
uniref:Fatty acid desaturase domain-containing protein n=1 Tax=Timspurckia oligopyrenoides TaxID=708627 RepID=A0A7S0ZKY9_9RHOD|mmetsp:Transcript_9278/g.16721  ORF Transcript_9278/g.16721 Transcript_9278/m.16721 type:complete len:390 (+) Transcript_9278:24-1193(+)